MESGMLSLHLVTKAVLGEELVRPKVLPGNFDFSFHLPDAENQVPPPASSCASQPSNVMWAQDAPEAQNQVFRHPGHSSKEETDVVPRGRTDDKEPADSSIIPAVWKDPVGSGQRQGEFLDAKTKISRPLKQTESEKLAHSQQNILSEWLGRGEVQYKPPETLAEATEQLEASVAEGEPVESSSADRMRDRKASINYMTQRLRCKNVLMAYALLDPYNRGYIDVQEAAQIIARIKSFRETSKHATDVAELLLVMVQDLVPYISSRGVIEKEDFLKQIYERVNTDYAGVTPYFCLRSNANPFVHARHEKETYTSLFSRAFYGGEYVPEGLTTQEEAQIGELRNGLQVPGNLEDHVREGQLRSMWRRARIKQEELMKELEECTFRPVTTAMRRPPKEIFPSKRRIREMLSRQYEERYGYPAVVHDLDPTVERSPALPPELDPQEKEKFEEFRRKDMLGTRKEDSAACENLFSRGEAYSGDSPGSPYSAEGSSKQDFQKDDEFSMKRAEPAVYVIHNGDPPPQAADWGLPLRDDWITQLPTDDSDGEEKRQVGKRMRPGKKPSHPDGMRSQGAYVRRERPPSTVKEVSSKRKHEPDLPPPLTTQGQYEVRAPYLVQHKRYVCPKSVSFYSHVHELDVETGSRISLKEIPEYYREALERLMQKELEGTDKSKTDELVLQKAKEISEGVMGMVAGESRQEK